MNQNEIDKTSAMLAQGLNQNQLQTVGGITNAGFQNGTQVCPTCGRCPTCGKGSYQPQFPQFNWVGNTSQGYTDSK